MKWGACARPKVDRVACPWLVGPLPKLEPGDEIAVPIEGGDGYGTKREFSARLDHARGELEDFVENVVAHLGSPVDEGEARSDLVPAPVCFDKGPGGLERDAEGCPDTRLRVPSGGRTTRSLTFDLDADEFEAALESRLPASPVHLLDAQVCLLPFLLGLLGILCMSASDEDTASHHHGGQCDYQCFTHFAPPCNAERMPVDVLPDRRWISCGLGMGSIPTSLLDTGGYCEQPACVHCAFHRHRPSESGEPLVCDPIATGAYP